MAFLIEVIKALVCFAAMCVGLGVLFLVWAVVREAAWVIKHENRKKYEQEDKNNENGSF